MERPAPRLHQSAGRGIAVLAQVVQTGHITIANMLTFAALCGAGLVAWRSQRGNFYKELAEERGAENNQLRTENKQLHQQRDLTPILERLDHVVEALEQCTATNQQVFSKVGEMNGALRHHGDAMKAQTEAMKALTNQVILDEAARALLTTAAERKGDQS